MGLDVLTAATGFISFAIFLLVHFITFRRVRPEHLLKSLLVCMMGLIGLPFVLMVVFCSFKTVDVTLQAWAGAAIAASLVHGLLCFVYVLCIFGPYETSVRMRLVREIARAGDKGISLEGLLGQYNAETIVKLRLQRLTGSGDIIEKEGRYRTLSKRNVFLVFDAIAGLLKKWIGR